MKKILSLLVVVLMASTMVAKPYKHSLGLNAGLQLGISYKLNINDHFTLFEEFIPYGGVMSNFSYSWLGDWLNLAYEAQAAKGQNILFSWYVGGGTKIGYVYGGGGVWGINALAGIEINMANAPIAVTFDFRPGYALCFFPTASWGSGGSTALQHAFDYAFCLGVRYTF